MDDLVGLAEIAQRAGTTRGYVRILRARHPDFPAPVAMLAMGPVWRWDEVAEWLARRKRG